MKKIHYYCELFTSLLGQHREDDPLRPRRVRAGEEERGGGRAAEGGHRHQQIPLGPRRRHRGQRERSAKIKLKIKKTDFEN